MFIGFIVMCNLLEGEFKGVIILVNIWYREVFGFKSYYYIGDVFEVFDLAIIIVFLYVVMCIVWECGKIGVGGIVILFVGFNEIDEEGLYWLECIKEIVWEYNMCVFGFNCMGFINFYLGFNVSFFFCIVNLGNIVFIF